MCIRDSFLACSACGSPGRYMGAAGPELEVAWARLRQLAAGLEFERGGQRAAVHRRPRGLLVWPKLNAR
eukprot:9207751-Alexandrium_andersonii.AAC.1